MAESEKDDKRKANRKLRKHNRQRIKQGKEPLTQRDVSDPWGMAKDGKFYFGPEVNRDGKYCMPNDEWSDRLMRK